jgi:hypothetical protein
MTIRYSRFSSSMVNLADQANTAERTQTGGHGGTTAVLRGRETFATRLVLPFRSACLGHIPTADDCETAERLNAQILGFLLQGIDLDAMPRPSDERLAEALAPLRKKLDTIIDMVARLSYRDVALPSLREVELGPTRIGWCSRQALGHGEWLRIELYFHMIFREPVTVFAKVADCAKQDHEETFRISAEMIEMPEHTSDNLARLALITQRDQRTRRSVWPVGATEI